MSFSLRMVFFVVLIICAIVLAAHPINAKYEESIKTPDCAQYPTKACSRIRDPVCGTNDITFPNECMLCLHNREYNQNVKIKKNGNC